jgi:hypothetical protein
MVYVWLTISSAFVSLITLLSSVSFGSQAAPRPESPGVRFRVDYGHHPVAFLEVRPSGTADNRPPARETGGSDLTRGPLDYLIRASAFPAQVAQSVEQRTENTRNSLTPPP